tara:strand:+ start:7170 stop:7331 length:162 start_codon:yes stop_codon:yes gene_type:complete
MKTLQHYKTSLGITNAQIKLAFDVSGTTVSKWLIDGAPMHVLRKLEQFSQEGK